MSVDPNPPTHEKAPGPVEEAQRRGPRPLRAFLDRTVQREGSTTVVVEADVDAVWDVVRDPTRVGEWSHECVGGEWVGDTREARSGARFRGRNRQGLIRWGRMCEVVSADRHRLVWRTVPTRLYPDSTVWSLSVAAVEGGTSITQSFEVVKTTKMERVYLTLLPAHRDRSEALRTDLERIGAIASGARGSARDGAAAVNQA